jgi:hypothetical protein
MALRPGKLCDSPDKLEEDMPKLDGKIEVDPACETAGAAS